MGRAAAGKLTVARELATLTGFRLFHNHLVVDALTAVFDFGTAPFIRLREQWWLAIFQEAAQQGLSLIFTFAPERTVSLDFIGRTIGVVEAAGGRVLFVELTCPLEEVERRIESSSRAAFGKLRSLEFFRELRQSGAFTYPKRSSRAQARAALGREFPRPLFRCVKWGPSSAIAHVSCAPSKIPDGGFSPVRLQAAVSDDRPDPARVPSWD